MGLLGVALGLPVGLALGLLGGGGSILTVPIFVYMLGFGAKEAIAMSLAVVGVTSLFGAAGHWRTGNVNLRVALVFGAVAMLGTYLGARLAVFFSAAAQLALFAVVMLVAAAFMFRGRSPASRVEGDAAPAAARMRFGLIALQGIAAGALTGLVGVGGGFLIVPALVLLGGLPMKQAVGTSLVIIAMNSLAGLLGHLGSDAPDLTVILLFVVAGLIGVIAGERLARVLNPDQLRTGFALFVALLGLFLLVDNITKLL